VKLESLNIDKHLRWTLWAGLTGSVAATVLVILFHFSQNSRPMILRILMSVDRLGIWAASWATSVVFPGDRIAYPMLNSAPFFDVVLILVTGAQTGFLGAFIGLILNHKSSVKTRAA
jgi:hypothetical protein